MKLENMVLEKPYRTWEQICLDRLKKIGIATAAQWAEAMGYGNNRNGVINVIKRIQKDMPEKLKIHNDRRPRMYEAL